MYQYVRQSIKEKFGIFVLGFSTFERLSFFKLFFLLFPIFEIIIYTIHNVVHSIRQSYNSRLKEYLKSNNRTNQHVIQNLHTICYMLHKLKRHFNIYI